MSIKTGMGKFLHYYQRYTDEFLVQIIFTNEHPIYNLLGMPAILQRPYMNIFVYMSHSILISFFSSISFQIYQYFAYDSATIGRTRSFLT